MKINKILINIVFLKLRAIWYELYISNLKNYCEFALLKRLTAM